MKTHYQRVAILGLILLGACEQGSEMPVDAEPRAARVQQPCRHYSAQRNPYFGDLHVHTRYSLDANTQGTIVGPSDAYRFATGETLGIQPYDDQGRALRSTRIVRPLDFAAVTDHAELFGETEVCTNPDESGYNSAECRFYRAAPEQAFLIFNLFGPGLPGIVQLDGSKRVPHLPFCGFKGERCLQMAKTPWADIQQAAEAYYDRSSECRFTSFVAYEYTAAPGSNNLHRNVIFESEVVPALPPAYQEYPAPEYLWQALDAQCRSVDGCNVLTIPHNSNLSGGLMFQTRDDKGRAYTAAFAQKRQAMEPLAEIYQHKGQSECLGGSGAGAADELCNFELLPYGNLTADRFGGYASGKAKEQDFLRAALQQGLIQEQKLGVNPFKYGFIASSDTHIGAPGNVLENNFPGHGGEGLSARDAVPQGLTDKIEYSPGGLAVLWAEQNTRGSLFAAMRRREAYGTTGLRPVVRFFGGWNLPAGQCDSGDFAAQGYQNGVPMGGDLPARPGTARAPRFAVSALRDPGAVGEPAQPLQHVQIIKGWVDASGKPREKVYEVAGNKDNGASVDLSSCEPRGSGYASLCAVWQDPDFDPARPAFYYARVIDNPSCRWSTQQCLAGHVDCSLPRQVPDAFKDCCNADYPKTIQERAWTSPIWYRPAAP